MRVSFCLGVVLTVHLCGPAKATDWPVTATGRIEKTDSAGTCSASLVRQNIVVTAAHCLKPGKRTYVFRPGETGGSSTAYAIRQIVRHPRYLMGGSKLKRQRYDMAVAVLYRPVP